MAERSKKRTKKDEGAAARDEALERAIEEAPAQREASPQEAVGPYLVYADWLQQRGDPRGELIVIQHALATAEGPRWAELKVREEEILAAHARQLYGPLFKWRSARRSRMSWRLGFVRHFDGSGFSGEGIEAPAFLAHPSARFVSSVENMSVDSLMRPAPATLRRVGLLRASLLEVLAAAPRLEVARLASSESEVPAAGTRHAALRDLRIIHPAPSLIAALAQLELPALARLSLDGVRGQLLGAVHRAVAHLGPKSLELGLLGGEEAAIDASLAGAVRSLRIHNPDAGLLAILRRVAWPNVTALAIPSGPEAALRDTVFSLFPELPSLRVLRLGVPADLVGYYRGLARSGLMARVERLVVTVARAGAGKALVEGAWPRLRQLDLSFEYSLSAEYLESAHVLGAEALGQVSRLRLSPAKHVPVLAKQPLAAKLEWLAVRVDTDWDMAQVLPHVAAFPSLKVLRIEGDRVLGAESLRAIGELPWRVEWPDLEETAWAGALDEE